MNPNIHLWILMASVAAAVPARAQVRLDWSTMHSTPGNDSTSVVKVDSAGNVYAAGRSNSGSGVVSGSAFVAAWDASGVALWSTTFDSVLGHAEIPSAIEFDGAGGLYVVGTAFGASLNDLTTFVLRIDAAGAITWSVEQPILANVDSSERPALVVDAQGRAIVGDRSPSGSGDLEITAYTPAGVVAWHITHDGSAGGVDRITQLALAPNGEIVAIGTVNAYSSTSSTGKPVLLRVAPGGALLQALEIVHASIPNGFGVDVEVDAQGRIFAAVTRGAANQVRWMVTHAFDALGNPGWVRVIEGSLHPFGGGAWAVDLEIDPFGRPVVMGQSAQGYAGYALVMAAYDVGGSPVWTTVENDVLGSSATELYNSGVELLFGANGEATVVGIYASADVGPGPTTETDAFVYAVDAPGQKRFGFTHGFPATPAGSVDYAFAAAAGTGQTFVLAGQAQTAGGFDAFVARFTRTAVGYCYGDGLAAACPCGNGSAPVERAGCASALGMGGRLADRGASSLSNDTLALVGMSMPDSFTVYFQGTLAFGGTPFGDGLLCAGGTTLRLGAAVNTAGASQYPASGDPPASVRGQVGAPGTRTYQAVYRNAAAFCTPATFNTTNGMQVTWLP